MIVLQPSDAYYSGHTQPVGRPANIGYGREKVHFAVVIGARGQLVAVENLQTSFTRRSERLMTVPQIERPGDSPPMNFLWGRTGAVLGIRRRKRSPGAFRIDELAFERFKAFHRTALTDVADIGLEGFLRFLEHWSPEQFQDVSDFLSKLDATLAFRFQYDDGFLHDRHAARLAWRRVLEREMPMGLSA